MTRKHFIALADALRSARPLKPINPNVLTDMAESQWDVDCRKIADVCRQFNPYFQREKFLAYTRK
jgi:hypothetical protein